MKKNYILLGSFVMISSLSLVVIAASLGAYYDSTLPSTVFVPSQATIFDHSINESVYDSGMLYDDFYDGQNSSREDESFNYVLPLSYDETGNVQLMTMLYENGTDVITISGSSTEAKAFSRITDEFPDKTLVYLDDTNWDADDYENAISVNYLANQGSFVEGILASLYVTSAYPNDPDQWVVGSWGGMQFLTVIQLMSGFEQGINWFNYYVLGTDVYGAPVDDTYESTQEYPSLRLAPGEQVKLIDFRGNTPDYNSHPGPSSDYYSNSFNIGEGTPYATGLIQNGANVIFPIAGGQTADGLDVISKTANANDPMKLIGVDTDARLAYPDYSNYILSSSLKNIQMANFYSLWYAQRKYEISEQDSDYPFTYQGQDVNPYDFVEPYSPESKGWMYDPENTNASNYESGASSYEYGDKFIAGYNNGGVGATGLDEENSLVIQAWQTNFELYSQAIQNSADTYFGGEFPYDSSMESLNDFVNISFNQQERANPNGEEQINSIENFSDTFLLGSSGNPVANVLHNTSNVDAPWIPDWNVY